MTHEQVIVTTVFGPAAENIEKTFSSFLKMENVTLHVFVYNPELPKHRHPAFNYHLVEPDADFVSVRRDALFRRWTLPDRLNAEYALVVDGIDAICLHRIPHIHEILKGGSLAAATEWIPPVPILGQGFTSTYINAGVTFWHLPSSLALRTEVERRGRSYFRGPFDDQTTLNEVVFSKYFNRLTILPPQYNWRALFRKSHRGWEHNFRSWPRVDSLDGVQIYHNQRCVDEVLAEIAERPPKAQATLPELPIDKKPLTPRQLFLRRLKQRWQEHGFF